MHELDEKLERMSRLCHAHRLGGILLTTQPNFAWITGGRSNRIDGSREPGNGAILVTSDGRRFVIANTIEMPRLLGETLLDVPCEPIEYPWVAGHTNSNVLIQLARGVSPDSSQVGADWPFKEATLVDRPIARARALLTIEETDRYRALGRDVGEAVGSACRTLEPGITEYEAARRTVDAVAAVGARVTVILAAADDRIARYRHPPPTTKPWRHLLMLVVCGERNGLVVAVTRLVSAGGVTAELAARTLASARVLERLLDATRPGTTGKDLFEVAARAYVDAGFPGEEARHHQGGPIGYQARDWLAHPASDERVQARQAFAWNPSITGTKVEETALVIDDAVEIITRSPGWPSLEMSVRGRSLAAPLVFERE